jgi:TetR/AcrR family transcriptional repressor of nem operon
VPWEKRFDEDQILDAAMQLFWERGYRGLSMADVVDALGINRSSLYATYGNKDALFRRALLRYDQVHREHWFSELSNRYGPVDSIRQAFAGVANAPADAQRFGCLLVNTTLDLPTGHSDFGDIVRAAFEATQQFFERRLELAKADGALSSEADTEALAATLMALFLGMRVLARADQPIQSAAPILRQVDTMLQLA